MDCLEVAREIHRKVMKRGFTSQDFSGDTRDIEEIAEILRGASSPQAQTQPWLIPCEVCGGTLDKPCKHLRGKPERLIEWLKMASAGASPSSPAANASAQVEYLKKCIKHANAFLKGLGYAMHYDENFNPNIIGASPSSPQDENDISMEEVRGMAASSSPEPEKDARISLTLDELTDLSFRFANDPHSTSKDDVRAWIKNYVDSRQQEGGK